MTGDSAVLIVHIGAGAIGLLFGAAALLLRKGSRMHRAAGNIFFVSMLIMSGLGAYLAYLISEKITVVIGVFTFYLVATAWATVIRNEGKAGRFEFGALAVALAVAAGFLIFGLEIAMTEAGFKIGFFAGFSFFLGFVAALAAISDASVLLSRGVSGARRLARHLWRMCFALFIAAFSFFVGQQDTFPAVFHGSPALFLPALAALGLLTYWLIRVRLTDWYKKAETSAAKWRSQAES